MSGSIVTGAAGAVGKPLCDELRARGHKVVSADVRHSGDDDAIRFDVSRFRQLERIFDQHRLRLVYHAAGEFSRWNGKAYYENMWLTNAVGTKNVLELARRYDCRVVVFSSSEVYGDFDGVMNEDVPDRFPLRQMNDYAISKWADELQAINAGLMHGTKVVRVRLFNTYGPGEYYHPYRSVICKFIYSALKGLPYTVYTQHHRSNSYIFDVVKQLAAFVSNSILGRHIISVQRSTLTCGPFRTWFWRLRAEIPTSSLTRTESLHNAR